MFRHLLSYELKIFIKNKDFLLWTIIFPLAFLSFFSLALHSLLEENPKIEPISLSIVEEGETKDLKEFLDKVGARPGKWDKGRLLAKESGQEENFLIYTIEPEDKAMYHLKKRQVEGVIRQSPKLKYQMAYSNDPISPSIISQVLEGYEQFKNTKESIGQAFASGKIRPELLKTNFREEKSWDQEDFLKTVQRKQGVAPQKIFFFSVLAYLAFYPISTGIYAIKLSLANQSIVARRKEISPISTPKRFLATLLPLTIFHILLISLTYLYARLLGSDFGSHHLSILLLLAMGSMAAIVTGSSLGAWLKAKDESTREALMIGLPLFFSFISGLMSADVHKIVMDKAPWLHNYNPLGAITNGLYILYMEGATSRYFGQIRFLAFYILLGLIITFMGIRRTRYDSI